MHALDQLAIARLKYTFRSRLHKRVQIHIKLTCCRPNIHDICATGRQIIS